MRVLVTGGCGFVGTHAVKRLIELGADVFVVDDLSTCVLDDNEHPSNIYAGAVYVRDYDRTPLDVDAVLHLGCRYPVERELGVWFHSHRGFVSDFLAWCGRALVARRLKRIVVGSTLAVYNSPETQGSFGSIAASLRQALAYWHRPPAFDVVFAHLPEVHGQGNTGGLPDSVPFKQTAHVDSVADVLAELTLSSKHRKSMDYVVGGELYEPLRDRDKVLPVELDIILKEM